MAVRFAWRFYLPAAPYSEMLKGYEKGLVHLLLSAYCLVLISGFLMLDNGFDVFGFSDFPYPVNNLEVNQFFLAAHRYSCIALSAMMVIHVSAVAA
jgi:cytochrome b561